MRLRAGGNASIGEALLAWKDAVWSNFDEVAASNRFFGWSQDTLEVREVVPFDSGSVLLLGACKARPAAAAVQFMLCKTVLRCTCAAAGNRCHGWRQSFHAWGDLHSVTCLTVPDLRAQKRTRPGREAPCQQARRRLQRACSMHDYWIHAFSPQSRACTDWPGHRGGSSVHVFAHLSKVAPLPADSLQLGGNHLL